MMKKNRPGGAFLMCFSQKGMKYRPKAQKADVSSTHFSSEIRIRFAYIL
jgi:hypothetical protein